MQIAINPGTFPIPNNISIGIRYTKLGIVCIISKTGKIARSVLSERAINTPTGIPTAIQIITQTVIIATVAMQSFHIPKYPIRKKDIAAPRTSFQLLDAIHAKPQITPIIIGQGELINSFSNQTKKYNKGSKKASIPSPYALEKSLNARSMPFLNSARADLSITGNFVKKSIILIKINEPTVK